MRAENRRFLQRGSVFLIDYDGVRRFCWVDEVEATEITYTMPPEQRGCEHCQVKERCEVFTNRILRDFVSE